MSTLRNSPPNDCTKLSNITDESVPQAELPVSMIVLGDSCNDPIAFFMDVATFVGTDTSKMEVAFDQILSASERPSW